MMVNKALKRMWKEEVPAHIKWLAWHVQDALRKVTEDLDQDKWSRHSHFNHRTLGMKQKNHLSVAISTHLVEKEHILPILCESWTTSTVNMQNLPYTWINFNLLLQFTIISWSLYIFIYFILHFCICLIYFIHTFKVWNTKTILVYVTFLYSSNKNQNWKLMGLIHNDFCWKCCIRMLYTINKVWHKLVFHEGSSHY